MAVCALLAAVLLAPALPAQPPGETSVNFSFDQVEIRILAKLVGDITGRKLVVGPDVKGKVTVVTPTRIPVSQVYPLFISILESSGYSVVRRDDIHHVVAVPRAEVSDAPVVAPGEPVPAGGLITRVFRLEHVNAADFGRTLQSMVRGGKAGGVTAFEPTNHLIVTDTAESVRRVERIIGEIDKPGLAVSTEIVPLTYAAAEDVAQQLTAAMARAQGQGVQIAQRLPRPAGSPQPAAPGETVIVGAPHSNSLILVGPPARLANLKQILAKLDVEPPSGHGRLSAIFLKYLSAEQAAKSLNALLAKSADKDNRQRIAIEADVTNNALIVDAALRDFEEVRGLVETLDQPPQQVLVEVMIAELSLEDGLDVGVDLFAGASPDQGKTEVVGSMAVDDANDTLMSSIMQGVIPQGLTIGLARGSYTDSSGRVVPVFPALINLNATQRNDKLKILSSVPLWAQNNQEATVNIVKNIPVLKSTIQGGSGTARDVIQNIERVDVGIKLTLTPHVNPNGEVLMKLNPNIEALISPTTQAEDLTPTITRREVSTTVTVPDGAVIVISGLIREDQVKRLRKVPLLGSIPGLGWLFRRYVSGVERTNLLIFVAPHIVTDMEKARAMKEALEQKTDLSAAPLTHTAGEPAD
ncbi:MAG: type II secretion system secretin GspD [Kiritimatiellae bacterium]|nr:type II secretion system secretin GspD [Kiritimatiellia bacterium]